MVVGSNVLLGSDLVIGTVTEEVLTTSVEAFGSGVVGASGADGAAPSGAAIETKGLGTIGCESSSSVIPMTALSMHISCV